MQIKKDIDILISKVISGNATEEELHKVEVWKAESEKNKQVFNKSLKAWKVGSSFISNKEIVDDKEKIQLQVNRSLRNQIYRKERILNAYRLVAAIAIPIVIAISLYFSANNFRSKLPESICQVTSPKGHISKCVLPDGTDVWVNSGSTISYDASAFSFNSREVRLDGEAYFEVKSEKKRPFKVLTNLANVKVTGTSFNVRAHLNTKTFETVLAEGSVELQLKNKQQQTFKMKPGEMAIYNSEQKELLVQEVDVVVHTSWRNGEIIFKDATLDDLITELERVYEIQFHLKNEELSSYRFRGMFSYDSNLLDALEKIRKTAGLDYRVENKEVWLEKKN